MAGCGLEGQSSAVREIASQMGKSVGVGNQVQPAAGFAGHHAQQQVVALRQHLDHLDDALIGRFLETRFGANTGIDSL